MSAKWIRVKRWDDQHLQGPLLPVKWILRAFSSITLAVILLILVAIYGTLASVPVGLFAKIPTILVYIATLVVALGAFAVVPTYFLTQVVRHRSVGLRWAVRVLGLLVLGVATSWVWWRWALPLMRYDPATGKGVMLFADFIERYQAVQVRRLPGMEMSELEFYAWWPLTLVLLLFVVNLVTATLRRIEFIVPKIGVLLVHTGIVTIALGSVIYAGLKQEGDMILLAGSPAPDGTPTVGPASTGFFDNTDVAIWFSVDNGRNWEARPVRRLPRYNDYNLGAVGGAPAEDPRAAVPNHRDYGPLAIDLRPPRDADRNPGVRLGDDLKARIVGYASYAELREAWSPAAHGAGAGGESMREIEVWLTRVDPENKAPRPVDQPQKVYTFVPAIPSERVQALEEVLATEYTIGMSEARWQDLQETLAGERQGETVEHALVVEVPGANFRGVYNVSPGQNLVIGNTGYRVQVEQLLDRPPFPIITRGYEGATSSIAIVRVIPPPGRSDGASASPPPAPPKPFSRWCYHRFPEIAQDMLDELNERGMPRRRDPDPAISIRYLDVSKVQVYFDEQPDRPGPDGKAPNVRAIVRLPGTGRVSVFPSLKVGDDVQIAPALKMRIGRRLENVHRVEVPRVVPELDRNKNNIGNHHAAAVAIRFDASPLKGEADTVWVPFTQYLGLDSQNIRAVTLADGRVLNIAFGRVRHDLPLRLALKDFDMIPYPHSDTPRDYRSDVIVTLTSGGVIRDEVRKTSLNEPLLVRVPYQDRPDLSRFENFMGRVVTTIIPTQYKFSQAGWDSDGWRRTKAMVDSGELQRPFARFTILGVGNNPGIYIIAAGAVMMSVGIPWAFYLKPILMRRRKRRLQLQLAREGRLPAHLLHEIGLVKQWPPPPSSTEPTAPSAGTPGPVGPNNGASKAEKQTGVSP